MAVDWRDLFVRYVEVVADAEGVDFLHERHWSPEEWAAFVEAGLRPATPPPPVQHPPHKHVQLRSDAGLHDQDSLEERLKRAEHDAGVLRIGERFRQSHCWLCRQASEEQEDVCRQRGHMFVEGQPYCTREPCQQRYPGRI